MYSPKCSQYSILTIVTEFGSHTSMTPLVLSLSVLCICVCTGKEGYMQVALWLIFCHTPCTGVAAQNCAAPELEGGSMTISVGTTVYLNGSTEGTLTTVQCFWNGSNGTVYTEEDSSLPSNITATQPVYLTLTVTALGDGSGEVYCNSTCSYNESDLQNISNSIFIKIVTGKFTPCAGKDTMHIAQVSCVTEH